MLRGFSYQPTWVDFAIFWGLCLSGVGLGVIFQMEIGAYDYLYWPPMALIVIVFIIAGMQIWRLRVVISHQQVIIRRIFPSNNIKLPISTIIDVDTNKHSFIINTRSYGRIKLVRLGRLQPLMAALSHVGIHVTQKGEAHV